MVDLVDAIQEVAGLVSSNGLDYVKAVNLVCDKYGDEVEKKFSFNREEGICEHNGGLSRECRKIEGLRCVLLRDGSWPLSVASSRDTVYSGKLTLVKGIRPTGSDVMTSDSYRAA